MATIKSYTDINQSKKLAEILPLETADMHYWRKGQILGVGHSKELQKGFELKRIDYTPCWSLAALLEQLKAEIQLENKQILFLHINKYNDINYDIRYTNSWTGEVLIADADNLVDVCVAMVEKLHELKML